MRRWIIRQALRCLIRVGLVVGLVVGQIPLALAWPDGPPPGHVGLDGQEHCGQCHYAGPPTDQASGLEMVNLPERVNAGEVVEFSLRLADPESRLGGFQLLVVDPDGEAGELLPDEYQALQSYQGRNYLGHTRPTASASNDDKHMITEWPIRWRVPNRSGRVRLLSAAVAANGDDSALGDNAYRLEIEVEIQTDGSSDAAD